MVALVLASSCGSSAQRSPQQRFATAIAAYRAAGTMHVRGRWTQETSPVAADLWLQLPGKAVGSVSELGEKHEEILYQDKQFVRGGTVVERSLGQHVGPKTAARWVILVNGFRFLTDRGPLPAGVDLKHYHLVARAASVVGGRRADIFTDSRFVLWTSVAAPYRVLRIETAPQYAESDAVTALQLDLSGYGNAVKVVLPPDPIDTGDMSTWPAHFELVKALGGTCTRAVGCPLSAVLTNVGGPGVGTATLAMEDPNHNLLASCQAPIPNIPIQGTATVSCTANSQALINFFSSASSGSYIESVELRRTDV